MEKKPFWKSLSFWSLIFTSAIEGAEKTGVIPSGTVGSVLQLLGLFGALFGRARATQPLGLKL